MPLRFSSDINRLRAALRGKQGDERHRVLLRAIDRLPAAALVTDNTSQYIAANALAEELTGYTRTELLTLTVSGLTPRPHGNEGEALWREFIASGVQRGEYELQRKNGQTIRVRYWAYASVAPGIHISLLQPLESRNA